MRYGEVNGIDHWFLPECPSDHSGFIAYTKYGGFEYWATKPDYLMYSYVIDEVGLAYLQKNFGEECDIKAIYIDRPDRGDIDPSRLQRDNDRPKLDVSYWKVIQNTGTLEDLKIKVRNLIKTWWNNGI